MSWASVQDCANAYADSHKTVTDLYNYAGHPNAARKCHRSDATRFALFSVQGKDCIPGKLSSTDPVNGQSNNQILELNRY